MKQKTLIQKLKSVFSNPQNTALLILLFGLMMRLCLLPVRWINPDEGAHLLDARLFLEGYTPIADYGSRQPLYICVVAAFLKIFGISLQIARLVPLFASTATGWMLFILGRRLVNPTAGLIASSLYLFLPLTIAWSVIVKEEPLAIFLSTLSFYCLMRASGDTTQKSFWFIGTGVSAALAYYARPSTLYLLLAIAVFIILSPDNSLKKVIGRLSLILLGYFAVCLAVCALFAGKMSWQEILFSQLNPLNLVWNRILLLFGMLPAAYRVVDTEGFRILDQSIRDTVKAWRESIIFCLFILAAAIAAISRAKDEKRGSGVPHRFPSFLFSAAWAGSVLLLYFFQSANRGFFTQYFVEALPPLCLLAAMWFLKFSKALKRSPIMLFCGCGGGFFFFYFVQRIIWQFNPGLLGYLVAGCFIAGILLLIFLPQDLGKLGRASLIFLPALAAGAILLLMGLFRLETIAALTVALLVAHLFVRVLYEKYSHDQSRSSLTAEAFVVVASLVVTGFYSGGAIGPKYEAVWSPNTLKQTVQVLKNEGEVAQEILSGGSIWTFQSGFRPFLNVSHPTEFFKKRRQDFEAQFCNRRPMFIIDDGYTERKYSRYWLFIKEEMDANYTKVTTIMGSKYPVTIFKLSGNPLSGETLLTLANSPANAKGIGFTP